MTECGSVSKKQFVTDSFCEKIRSTRRFVLREEFVLREDSFCEKIRSARRFVLREDLFYEKNSFGEKNSFCEKIRSVCGESGSVMMQKLRAVQLSQRITA